MAAGIAAARQALLPPQTGLGGTRGLASPRTPPFWRIRLATIADEGLFPTPEQYHDNAEDAENHGHRCVENARGHRVPQPGRGILFQEWLQLLQTRRMHQRPDLIDLGVQQ